MQQVDTHLEEITESSRFVEDLGGDSLRAIEILARIEKKYGIEIPQEELAGMTDLGSVYQVIKKYAGWED